MIRDFFIGGGAQHDWDYLSNLYPLWKGALRSKWKCIQTNWAVFIQQHSAGSTEKHKIFLKKFLFSVTPKAWLSALCCTVGSNRAIRCLNTC